MNMSQVHYSDYPSIRTQLSHVFPPPQLRGGWRPFLVIEPCNLGGRNSYHPPPPTLNIYRAWSLPVVVVVGRRFVYEIFRFCYRDSVCHWLQIEKRVKTDDLLFQISIREHVISSIAMLYDPPESGFDYKAQPRGEEGWRTGRIGWTSLDKENRWTERWKVFICR